MPLIFNLMFRSGGFSSFLMRQLDLFRKMAFRGGLMFKRPVDTQAMEQYRMPHPTAATRAGIAAFPKMIPLNTNHPNAEYISEIDRTLQQWDIPVLVMFSDKDIAFKVEEGQRIANMVPNGRFQVVREGVEDDQRTYVVLVIDGVAEAYGPTPVLADCGDTL